MAARQEQESAREEVTEVAPGLLRLELPIRMPGLGHVNCYAMLDKKGVALVDPGLPGPVAWRDLQTRLRRADLKLSDVHTVIVTHSHPDHFGGASRLARETGARVVAHHGFQLGQVSAPPDDSDVSVEAISEAAHSAQGDGHNTLEPGEGKTPVVPAMPTWTGTTPWGGERPKPPLRTRLRWRVMRLLTKTTFLPEITEPVEHGEVIELMDREWFVVHTPGHTTDHICFHDPDRGIFLAGDHVLPTITPHISGLGTTDALASFFYSLDRVAELPDIGVVLPAHGHPFEDLAARCRAIKRHHDERLDRVKEIGRALGPATVEAFSQQLFRPRSWGGMAESETYAHLEHLRIAGDAESRGGPDGKLIYETG